MIFEQQCEYENCAAKAGDRICDKECNTFVCNFDGGDCSLGINPWRNCTAPIRCWEVFNNKICNEECNTPECLFDGRECEKQIQPCQNDAYCRSRYGDGHCDTICNNMGCNWDGLDCDTVQPVLADGVINVVLLVDMPTFRKDLVTFLREVRIVIGVEM